MGLGDGGGEFDGGVCRLWFVCVRFGCDGVECESLWLFVVVEVLVGSDGEDGGWCDFVEVLLFKVNLWMKYVLLLVVVNG